MSERHLQGRNLRNIVRTIPTNPTFPTKVISRTIPADGEAMVEDDGQNEKLVPHVSTEFAAEVFDLNSIKKAAYRVCDIAAVDIEPKEGRILCTLRFHQGNVPISVEKGEAGIAD